MYDPSQMLDDEMGMDPSMGAQLQGMEMDPSMNVPHPSMMPPPVSMNGGIQPKQEFVKPTGMGDPLFDTLMSNQIESPMPQDPSMMGMMQEMQAPPQPPTAMQPPVSDMMQDPNLFNEMMGRQALPGGMPPQFPPQY